MLVKHILENKPRDVITAAPATSLEAAMDLLISNNIGCLPVVAENNQLVGILSDKDIFRKLHESKGEYSTLSVGDVMSTQVIVGVPDDDLTYIAGIMDKNWIRHVPILEGEKIIGIVSQRDIIKTQAKHHEAENRYLNLYMDMLHRRDKSGDL
jgi:CBS domain-containing protein